MKGPEGSKREQLSERMNEPLTNGESVTEDEADLLNSPIGGSRDSKLASFLLRISPPLLPFNGIYPLNPGVKITMCYAQSVL